MSRVLSFTFKPKEQPVILIPNPSLDYIFQRHMRNGCYRDSSVSREHNSLGIQSLCSRYNKRIHFQHMICFHLQETRFPSVPFSPSLNPLSLKPILKAPASTSHLSHLPGTNNKGKEQMLIETELNIKSETKCITMDLAI